MCAGLPASTTPQYHNTPRACCKHLPSVLRVCDWVLVARLSTALLSCALCLKVSLYLCICICTYTCMYTHTHV